jgi:hypothetical protein
MTSFYHGTIIKMANSDFRADVNAFCVAFGNIEHKPFWYVYDCKFARLQNSLITLEFPTIPFISKMLLHTEHMNDNLRLMAVLSPGKVMCA